jgi:hypothetical protein
MCGVRQRLALSAIMGMCHMSVPISSIMTFLSIFIRSEILPEVAELDRAQQRIFKAYISDEEETIWRSLV